MSVYIAARQRAKDLYRMYRRARMRHAVPPDANRVWRAGVSEEVDYWREWLADDSPESRTELLRRKDPAGPITDPLLQAHLSAFPSPQVSILDVGAGPLSAVGRVYPGKVVSLTAVDPLASEYDALLAEVAITPPTRTLQAEAEQLLGRFAPGTFDVAYARNALDHSWDPLLAIRQMLAVVKLGGVVVLRHFLQEAENGRYNGLHQWNFDRQRGDFVIWGAGVHHNVSALLAPSARVVVHQSDVTGRSEVTCVLTKNAELA